MVSPPSVSCDVVNASILSDQLTLMLQHWTQAGQCAISCMKLLLQPPKQQHQQVPPPPPMTSTPNSSLTPNVSGHRDLSTAMMSSIERLSNSLTGGGTSTHPHSDGLPAPIRTESNIELLRTSLQDFVHRELESKVLAHHKEVVGKESQTTTGQERHIETAVIPATSNKKV
eukprot:PhF_6_TR38588/c7_g1_i1/m.57362